MNEWISVKNKMPEEWELVLIWDGETIREGQMYEVEEEEPIWVSGEWPISDVTHWMPMPNPPKIDAFNKSQNNKE